MSEGDVPLPVDPEQQGRWLAEVIRAVQTPAILLQWFGVGSLVLAAFVVTVFLAAPDAVCEKLYDREVKAQRDVPAAERQKLPPYSDFVRAQQIQYVAAGAICLPCGFLIAFGGMKMRQLTGFGWALTGSILSIIPFTNMCCCAGLPIGLWALVVLFGSDVRLAFSRVGAAGGLEAYEAEVARDLEENPPSKPPTRLE